MKKNWSEEEHGFLVGGLAEITYEYDGKHEKEKVKFVGKLCHIEQQDRKENPPYFKGVIFDMYNNEQGSVSWTEKEFKAYCNFFTDLF